jgi:hypothetical protein
VTETIGNALKRQYQTMEDAPQNNAIAFALPKNASTDFTKESLEALVPFGDLETSHSVKQDIRTNWSAWIKDRFDDD